MNLAIETKQLTRFFENFCAVDQVELKVERGTFYGFLGPNGAGKSTTIKMLTGLLAPSSGEILVLGKRMLDPQQSLEAKSLIGVVPEDLALFDNLTAREHLTFIGRMYLMPKDTIRERIDELISMLELAGDETKLTMEYSHGMKMSQCDSPLRSGASSHPIRRCLCRRASSRAGTDRYPSAGEAPSSGLPSDPSSRPRSPHSPPGRA